MEEESKQRIEEEDDSEDDEDFAPTEEVDESDKGEAVWNEELGVKGKRGKKESARKSKRAKITKGRSGRRLGPLQLSDDETELKTKSSVESPTKSSVDDIWASMKQETLVKKEMAQTSKIDSIWEEMKGKKTSSVDDIWEQMKRSSSPNKQDEAKNVEPKTVKVVEKYDFAGEVVEVTKEVNADQIKQPVPTPKKKGNLDHLLANITKPKKISTITKSALDWDGFKKKEGIEDELKKQAMDGYLEKQAFLQRADLRAFENEKAIRLSKRK